MTAFICPLCQTSFQQKNNSLVCNNNHHFDIAKEGYVNLLPVQAKGSKQPGDNQQMMIARRNFLDSDGYLPLAQKIVQLAKHYLQGIDAAQILDLGCGEGYYTNLVANALPEHQVYGLDISKVAVRYAAKRYKNVNFCVASAFQVPIADNDLDMIIRIYAPSKAQELARLINKNGYLITVTPAPGHLLQLREVIYEQVKAHPEEHQQLPGLQKLVKVRLNYCLDIQQPQQLIDLINMTPFAWKMSQEKRDKLLQKGAWKIDCDFNIEIFQRI